MDAAAKAAIGAGDDVLAADDLGIAQDAVGDELRVLDVTPTSSRSLRSSTRGIRGSDGLFMSMR